MEHVIDELEMIASPLAESEDSLISEMSTRHDVAKASWLEMRERRILEDDDGLPPPPLPERDYSRLRPAYRKRGDEFNFFTTRPRPTPPARPRTPEHRRYSRNARKMVDRKKEAETPVVYATPNKTPPTTMIEEFNEPPRYARRGGDEEMEATTSTSDVEGVASSSKIGHVEQRLKALRMVREDSLTSLLKKQLEKRTRELPEYVEPKHPIVKELQEFLKIEPSKEKSSEDEESKKSDEPSVKAGDHKLIVKGFQKLIKTPSGSTTSSSTSSTIV